MTESNWFEKSGITENQAADILEAGRELWKLAEPGFKEVSTHEFLSRLFRELGFEIESFDGIPGFIAAAPGAEPVMAVIADMDGLPNPGNPNGGYIHSCGHHMQTANIYGAARLLGDAGSPALKSLAFIAVPAEEYIDLDSREELRLQGRIRYLSGKQELLDRGILKRFSHVISTHAAGFEDPEFISSVLGMGGFEVLRFTFTGKASHAGAHPYKGINAQNAGSLFLQACAFLRESFNESDHIRIHPILTLPEGQSVNIIPDTAFVETYVRAANPEAIAATSAKLKAAADGCAASIGAEAAAETVQGYAPFVADLKLHSRLRETVESLGIPFIEEEYSAASSDMGDVSRVIPSIMLGLPGVNGLFHNPGFRVTDETAAFVLPSAVLARYLDDLFKKPV